MEVVSTFLQRTPVGQLVAEQFAAAEKQIPPLHKECLHVDTHELNLGTFTKVAIALCFLP